MNMERQCTELRFHPMASPSERRGAAVQEDLGVNKERENASDSLDSACL